MANFQENEVNYVIWQNRAFEFYVGARSLYSQQIIGPTVYCAVISIELLLKATLIFFDRSFVPNDAGHNIDKMQRILQNKGPRGVLIEIPQYFLHEDRYLSLSRYPRDNGSGIGVPSSFLEDLDSVFADLVCLVPFQYNTMLRRTIFHSQAGNNGKEIPACK